MLKTLAVSRGGTGGSFAAKHLTLYASTASIDPITTPAVYYNGKTYVGFVDSDGKGRALSYDHTTGTVVTSPVILSGLSVDAHLSPSLHVRQSDHKLLWVTSPHAVKNMYLAVSTNAEDVSSWGAATDYQSSIGGTGYTYPHFFQLSGESGKIYMFFRDAADDSHPHYLSYSTSTDGGATWSSLTHIYTVTSGLTPYWSIDSNQTDRVDFYVTDGETSHGVNASLYHFYYSGGNYYKTNGTQITTTLPLGPSDLTKVYDGSSTGSLATGIAGDGPGLAVTFETSPPAGWMTGPQLMWYAVYTGGAWVTHQFANSGITPFSGWTSGGEAISHKNPNQVFLVTWTSGVPQVFLYETSDHGSTWSSRQITTDAADLNFGIVTPRYEDGSDIRAVWLHGSTGSGGNIVAYPFG